MRNLLVKEVGLIAPLKKKMGFGDGLEFNL